MNFDTKSFQEFKQLNDLSTGEALTALLNELERLKNKLKVDGL
jgi:hypothetical protein